MINQETNKLNDIGRMITLAEMFASEGQMNLNKTLEAIAYSQIRRAAWNYRPEVTDQSMQAELAQCLDDIGQADILPDLVAVLETGQRALEEQRQADLLFEEAPDVFVCRTCGFTAFDVTQENCPDCGTRSGSFRKFVAFFNRDNAEPSNPFDTLSILQQNADDLKRLAEHPDEYCNTNMGGSVRAFLHAVISSKRKEKDMPFTRNQDIKVYV